MMQTKATRNKSRKKRCEARLLCTKGRIRRVHVNVCVTLSTPQYETVPAVGMPMRHGRASAARAACELEAHGALEHGEKVDRERVGERLGLG